MINDVPPSLYLEDRLLENRKYDIESAFGVGYADKEMVVALVVKPFAALESKPDLLFPSFACKERSIKNNAHRKDCKGHCG